MIRYCKDFFGIVSSSRILPLAAVMLVLLVASGCGYRFAGSSANRLNQGQKVWVAFISNETVSPTAQTVIRRALLDQLHSMRGISPAGNQAEAGLHISGALRSYSSRVMSYTSADRSGEIRLTITADCEVRKSGEVLPLWKGAVQAFQDYPASTDLALQKNAEEAAVAAASRKLAEKLITAVEQSY
jgi:outer membrane lipopolysaccharide assembly protein LptE/RlpB